MRNTLIGLKGSLVALGFSASVLLTKVGLAAPLGTVSLSDAAMRFRDGYVCGAVGDNLWVPGRRVAAGLFIAHDREIENLSAEVSRTKSEKRSKALKSQLNTLKKLLHFRESNCNLLSGQEVSSSGPFSPTALNGVASVALGRFHSCALLNTGGVKCWGSNDFSPQYSRGIGFEVVSDPTDVSGMTSGIIQVGSREYHNCTLSVAGVVNCRKGSKVFKTVSGLPAGVVSMAVGAYHGCALLSNGGVKCWDSSDLVAEEIGLTEGVRTITAGARHTCALLNSGSIKCWGDNEYGQLGNKNVTQSESPVDVNGLNGTISSVVAGLNHTCAVVSGGAKCWGSWLGSGVERSSDTDEFFPSPSDVKGLSTGVSQLTAGDDHTCAKLSSGGVKCWGRNSSGELGNGGNSDSLIPTAVQGFSSEVKEIYGGDANNCAITNSGALMCWGANSQLEVGHTVGMGLEIRSLPKSVIGLSTGVVDIAVGDDHSCAVLVDGSARCWGSNSNGELGDGSITGTNNPVPVIGLSSGVQQVAVGGEYSCALVGGAVKCWGRNEEGQLGDDTKVNKMAPSDVKGLSSGVVRIQAGPSSACALLDSGKVKCWGNGASASPVDVRILKSRVVDISVGPFGGNSCALLQSGEVQCWKNTLREYARAKRALGGYEAGVSMINILSIPLDTQYTNPNVFGSRVLATLVSGQTTCVDDLNLADDFCGKRVRSGSGAIATRVRGLADPVAQISIGASDACGLSEDGAVYCWQYLTESPLGRDYWKDRKEPLSGLSSGIAEVGTGGQHSCVLTNTGAVKCWGIKETADFYNTPQAVYSATDQEKLVW